MRGYIIIAAIIAATATAGWITLLQIENSRLDQQVDALSRELAVAEDVAEQANQAKKIADAQRRIAVQRTEQKAKAVEALLTGDYINADTPIDSRLTDFLDCVRASGGDPADCSAGLGGSAPAGPDQRPPSPDAKRPDSAGN